MRWLGCLSMAALLAATAVGADPSESARTRGDSLPPVLQNEEPAADVIVRLPGPARSTPAPVVETAKAAVTPVRAIIQTPPPEDPARPVLRHIYPPSFEADSALFCQTLIGQWTVTDARFLLGEPLRQRPAYDDRHSVSGRIYAFSDPTKRYREMELDFGSQDGTLRTVFVYPWNLTWQDCRRIWGVQVSETGAAKGRKFYSYLNRRMDVLVDPAGKVISLGLY